MAYENLLKFYQDNKDILIYGDLKPAKSITRNIATGIMPFIHYYRQTHITRMTEQQIAVNICKLDDASSTSRDNIRNMQELRFIDKEEDSQYWFFTSRFTDFCNSGLTILEYVSQDLRTISKLSDITMFYNLIICTLIDGLTNNGKVILYPESKNEFFGGVLDTEMRASICERIYEIYGFKGTSKTNFGEYTPNANYRIISTCTSLHLLKRDGTNEYGFKKYVITPIGYSLLNVLNSNLQNN